MGATASINASSRKYKTSEPIEVKFNKVVKYDDGDEKPFRDDFQLTVKKQPLSLLATAIKILEKKPKDKSHLSNNFSHNYARQARPRSAYIVLKKPTFSTSTVNSSHQNSSLPSGMNARLAQQQKQFKTKQNLYLSLINPESIHSSRYTMSVPSRRYTPMDYHLSNGLPKANTLPRHTAVDGKRVKVDQKSYIDMIRPIMMSPQYLKVESSRRMAASPVMRRTTSRQSHVAQSRLTPKPPNNGELLRRLDQNSRTSLERQDKSSFQRELYTPISRPPSSYTFSRNGNPVSFGRGSLPHRDVHLPRLNRKTRDEVSLGSSLHSRSQIPRSYPDNIKPLYFRKSLAYSPHYEHKDLLSSPLSSMNT